MARNRVAMGYLKSSTVKANLKKAGGRKTVEDFLSPKRNPAIERGIYGEGSRGTRIRDNRFNGSDDSGTLFSLTQKQKLEGVAGRRAGKELRKENPKLPLDKITEEMVHNKKVERFNKAKELRRLRSEKTGTGEEKVYWKGNQGHNSMTAPEFRKFDAIKGGNKLTAAELSEAKKYGIDPARVLAMKYGIPRKLTRVGPGVSDEQAAQGLPKKFDAARGGLIGPSKFTTNNPALKPGEKLDLTNGEIVRIKKNLPGDHLSKDGKVVLDKDNEIVRLTAKGKRGSVSSRLQLLRQEVENQKSGKFDAIRGGQLSDVKKLVAAHDKAVQKAYDGKGSEKAIEKIANKAFEKHGVSLYVTAQPGIRETEGLTKTGRDLRPVLARAERMAAGGGGGGKGRGNWGHKGRPGKRGGSA